MLYAYLLTRTEFHIESAPQKDTRDSRYAHSLYLDLLLLILRLSGCKVIPGAPRCETELLGDSNLLSATPLSKSLSADLAIRELIAKGTTKVDRFDPILRKLYDKIVASSIFTDYRKKKRHSLADDVQLWRVLLSTVLLKNPDFVAICRDDVEYTTSGLHTAFMLADSTLGEFNDSRSSLANARKQLQDSLDKAYELYVSLLMLPMYLTRLEEERLEAAKEKYCPSDEDLNPNLRFVNNAFVRALRNSPEIEAFAKSHPVAWEGDYFFLKQVLDAIRNSELYRSYMEAEHSSFTDDCEFWRDALKDIVFPGDPLAEALENNSVYWNDDLHIMGTFTLKTIRQFGMAGDGAELELLPMYKNDDDANFGPLLFAKAVENREEYREYVDRFINGSQWDPERLAFTDIVILIAAIAELLNFPSIPVPVTLNEYIEIANYYSTARSGQFINGVLYSVVNYLREQGKLLK